MTHTKTGRPVKRIIRIRKSRKTSQEELADNSGLDRTYISGVERMKRNLSVDTLEKIIKGLRVSSDKFFKDISKG